MTVRTGLHALLTALALTLVPSVAAEARSKPRPCPASAEHRSGVARLYVSTSPRDDTLYRVVSCVLRTRERRVLATWYWEGSITDQPGPQYWLTGRFAAINQAYCSADPFDSEPCVGTLKVIDLRSGEKVASAATGDFLNDMVLTRRGSVGMIHRKQLTLVRKGAVEVVDAAADFYSLAHAEQSGTLYWTSGGQPRSTPLR